MKRTAASLLVTLTCLLCSCSLVRPPSSTDSLVSYHGASETRDTAATVSALRERDGLLAEDIERLLSQGITEEVEPYPGLEFVDAPEVERFVRLYTREQRRLMQQGLKRKKEYSADLEPIFRGFGIPVELLSIVMVESCFRPLARSHQGAVGLWQFTRDTGRAYGLRVSLVCDDRHHVERSTIAAAKYLSDLYQQFNDWYLALAAYNLGPSRVSAIMRRAARDDFFALSRQGLFRTETRDFVAKVAAVARIFQEPERYGFYESEA